MKDLSNLEAALLISIKINPDRHQVFHAGSVCATIFEIGRAVTVLKNLNYITENDRGRFHVNQPVLDRLNTEVMHEENSSGVVHRSDSAKPTVETPKAETPAPAKIESKPLPTKPTQESLLQQLAEYGSRGAIAQTLANAYGVRGIAIAQMLRKLREEGKVTKHETFWFIATKEDAVTHIEVPYEARRAVTSPDELKKLIQLQKGWFTAKESFDEVSKAFIVEWPFFYGVFMGMSEEGDFNIKEDGELVSYELSCDGDNLHANCRFDFTADEFNKIIQDYMYLMQQGGTHRWNLSHCVEVTKLRSDLILHWFELAGFDISDVHSIGKKEQPEYMPVDRLNAQASLDFISAEGCSVKAFVKFFNLDPAVIDKIGPVLAQVGLARYDEENKFLMLPNEVAKAPADEPRVTVNPETGIDTIELLQIPNDGFVFIEVEVDADRAVASQYFYGNSMFNGMHITPTDVPNVYNLQVPEAFAQEIVEPEGMYENVRVDQSDDGLPVMLPASHSVGDYTSRHFEKRAEEQKENPPERMYFNGEKPKGEISAESRSLVDDLLAAISERIPAAGETGPVGPIGCEGVAVEQVEHSSMLQIDRPLLGMHLFRVSELAEPQKIPETVEDENSPYFGCKITPCDGDKIGYATITIEPGHPMWQPPRYMYTSDPEAFENGVKSSQRDPLEDKDIFGNDAEPLNEPDGDPEAEEYAAALEPHLTHLLNSMKGVPGAIRDYAEEGVKGNPANGCGVPVRTVKPEWIVGLDLIADQHKRSSATRKLLMEIKEYLEK